MVTADENQAVFSFSWFFYEKESYTGNDISESYFSSHYRCVFISRRKRL